MQRLCLDTVHSIPPAAQPPVDPRDIELGIVHLGIGAFHRAHQAVYTQAAMAESGDLGWGVCGVTQRSSTVVDQLGPQGGLYSVLTRSAGGSTPLVNAAVRRVLPGMHSRRETVQQLATPAVRVVTLTVTEKGYRHEPATGRLHTDDVEVAADLGDARPDAPVTVVGQLVRGLQQRMRQDCGPISVVCCDNLPSNGRLVQSLVLDFVQALPASQRSELLEWISTSARFPGTMVDRIVPATTEADRAEIARLLGVDDHGVVVAEPFSQWVIEDDFAASRPRWELAGATLTHDVAPYEAMKLRLLNGSHSALAYLGSLAGFEYLSDVVADEGFRDFVTALMDVDVTPTLDIPAGFDLDAYKQQLLQRFANPALRHRTLQIAMDGSQKLPQRLLATIRDRRAAGALPRYALLAVAAWLRQIWSGSSDDGRPLPLDDPLSDRLRSALGAADRPAAVVNALLGVHEVFGVDLAEDQDLRQGLVEELAALTRYGAAATVSGHRDRAPT